MKKFVILTLCLLVCGFALSEPLLNTVADIWGIEGIVWLVAQPERAEYEGGLSVVTGYLPSGRHIQLAERNGRITVGIPYITEGY